MTATHDDLAHTIDGQRSAQVLTGTRSQARMTDPHTEQVVLLGADHRPIGHADKATVHSTDTPLHLAFSCYLRDEDDRVLLTRRAMTKATWPGVWTNTCCGHPAPGEAPAAAVRRRLHQELGVTATDLRLVLPRFTYRAVDPSGIVEHEVCPVWVGRLSGPRVLPDPAEVMATSWVGWADLVRLAETSPDLLSPWAVAQVADLAALERGVTTA